jgi:hypothetical protein
MKGVGTLLEKVAFITQIAMAHDLYGFIHLQCTICGVYCGI